MVFLFVFSNKNISANENQNIKEQSQYQRNIKGLHKISFNNFMKKYNSKKRFTTFIGFKECPYCQKFSYKLKKFNKKNIIYYLNFDDLKNNYMHLIKIKNIFKIKYVPTMETFSNKKIVSSISGSNANIKKLKL